MHWIITSLVAPALVSVITGVGSGYLTIRIALVKHSKRIDRNEDRLESMSTEIQSMQKRLESHQTRMSESLTRLETKMDLILSNRIDFDDCR